MGLLKLLAFPVTGPLWIAKVVQEEAERQLYDEDAIRVQIADLQEQRQGGVIDQETFDRQEETLFERLIEAREYHRRKAVEERDG